MSLSVQHSSIGNLSQSAIAAPSAQQEALSQVVQMTMLSDIDAELTQIGADMKAQTETRKEMREEIATISSIYAKPSSKDGLMGRETIAITAEERDYLISQGYPEKSFQETESGSTYTVEKDALKTFIDNKQEALASSNSDAEMTALRIQSLVDQRKNLTLLLSNLMSAEHETLMSIIRNLKG